MKNSWVIMNHDIASSHLYYSVQRRKQNHSHNSRLLHYIQLDCIAAVPAHLVMTDRPTAATVIVFIVSQRQLVETALMHCNLTLAV